jgi:hypothetical protein
MRDWFGRNLGFEGKPGCPIEPRLRTLNARVRPGYWTIDENEGAKGYRLP